MMKRTLITSLALAASAALPLAASAVISPLQERPLETCDAAIRSELGDAQVTDTFHRRAADGSHQIYANVVQFDGSTNVTRRVTCETSPSGHKLRDLRAEAGRWVEADRG